MGKVMGAVVLSLGLAVVVSSITGANYWVCFLGGLVAFSMAK